ncbi:MAG: peptidoglycan-binding protein [Cyanomargarita calcarea GSE-NOS-MK-12-04C]|uniref:Peptidoglycan-binding protein n=1 Tax=Cyanomargarita calcarea GSE-NOS-MK-12-04C TaxID=2839659 RepID=A0A951QP31_9CYAN|nr:peptidoglycan-binding protein [Cyanomargarita calcarea GSE-NOS-MK-12-04C]
MEYLAYSQMVIANEEAITDTELNLPKFKISWKKLFRTTCVAVAGFGVLFATVNQAAQAASIPGFVRTNGSCLRVRSAPSINSPVVACLRNGARVAAVVDTENGFTRISSGDYVATKFISTSSARTTKPRLGVGGRVVLGAGSEGQAVSRVQRTLGNVPVTGYYGELTERAVRKFQANYGLAVDGRVGPQTRIAMGL